MMNENYSKDYSERGFWEKLTNNIQSIGKELLYNMFLLFYLLQEDSVPAKVKASIVAVLGYFIAPLDLIPDITPVVGYADDGAVIAGSLALAIFYITPEIKEKARNKVEELFN